MIKRMRGALGALVVLAVASAAQAGTVTWTDWTGGTTGAAGTAVGTMGGVSVTYTGDVNFIQNGVAGNLTDYYNPSTPYTSATVSNRPTAAEMVSLRRSGITNTLTFGSAVTNPVMSLVSVGRTRLPVTYDFDTPFVILSQGTGYWGGTGTSFTTAAGDQLIGSEGHGTIQFLGTVTSISWVNDPSEDWHGFTVGNVSAVPLPPAGLMGLGLLGMAVAGSLRRRRRDA